MAAPQIEYVIVMDGGTGQDKFLKLFKDNWGILASFATGNAVHYVMRKEDPKTDIVTPPRDGAIIPTPLPSGGPFSRRRR